MIRPSIRLLVTLALTTAALSAGWTHAFSGSRAIGVSSLSSAGTPVMVPYSGEPDPGLAPVPKLITSHEYSRESAHPTLSWFSWASRVWAMWYLRTVR